MSMDLSGTKCKDTSGLTFEVNTILCSNLRAKHFVNNNDVNLSASCLCVDFSKKDLFTIHVVPQFWKFVFEKKENSKSTPISKLEVQSTSTTTYLRIAHKEFQMGVVFDFGAGGEPTNGYIVNSQKDQVYSMMLWDNNPFVH